MAATIPHSAARYAAGVFAIGCALGTLREVVVAPRLGRTVALAIETPAMLAVCARLSSQLVRRDAWSAGNAARVGVTALPLLVGMEEVLARALRDGSVLDQWRHQPWADLAITGLGLLGFAAMPAVATLLRIDDGQGDTFPPAQTP